MNDKCPPCRVCKSDDQVYVWDPKHPERTICWECCQGGAEHHDGETGHSFTYHRGEGLTCDYCGIERQHSDYDYSGEFYD